MTFDCLPVMTVILLWCWLLCSAIRQDRSQAWTSLQNLTLGPGTCSVPAWPVQDASEQRPHKLSYHLAAKGEEAEQVINELESALKGKGISAKVIYSGGADVDILAAGASKGEGLKFLLKQARSILAQKHGHTEHAASHMISIHIGILPFSRKTRF